MYMYKCHVQVAVVVSRLPNGTDQWTSPIVVSQRKGYSNQNPVLFYDNQTNILYLFHTQQDAKKMTDAGLSGEGNARLCAPFSWSILLLCASCKKYNSHFICIF